MTFFTLLLAQLALLSPAWSQSCRVVNDPRLTDTNPHFTIENDRPQARIGVISLADPPPAVRQAAADLLRIEEAPDQFAQRLRAFLVANAGYVFTMRTQFNNLAQFLGGGNYEHVAIDLQPERILPAEKEAWDLITHAQGFYRGVNPDDLTSVLILAVGPAMAMRVRHANIFIGIRLEGLPAAAAVSTPEGSETRSSPRPKRTRSHARADAKYDEVLDHLESSASSKREFRRMVKKLKQDPEPYGDLSVSETKERLLGRFWRPARKHVKEWLDVFYTENSSSLIPAAAGPAHPLLGLSGNWLVYLPADRFHQTDVEIPKLCKIN